MRDHKNKGRYNSPKPLFLSPPSSLSDTFMPTKPTQTIVANLTHLGLLSFSGEEARDFLHKQLTNDVAKLPDNLARHAAWCTAKGRMLASVVVYPHESDFHLILSSDLREATQKRMQMFILRSKVKAADVSDRFEIIGLAGPGAVAALTKAGLSAPELTNNASEAGLSITKSESGISIIRLDTQRFLLVVPVEQSAAVFEGLETGTETVDANAWQMSDIEAGLPVITQATREAFVPQMVDFDTLGGVSFKKGCYPGQEIVARTHYLGKVKRHLYRVTSNSTLEAGQELASPATPDQSAGMIVSAQASNDGQWIGLASILETAADDIHVGTADGVLLQAVRVYLPTTP